MIGRIPQKYQGNKYVAIFITDKGEYEVTNPRSLADSQHLIIGKEKLGYKRVGLFMDVNAEFSIAAERFVRTLPPNSMQKIELSDILKAEELNLS